MMVISIRPENLDLSKLQVVEYRLLLDSLRDKSKPPGPNMHTSDGKLQGRNDLHPAAHTFSRFATVALGGSTKLIWQKKT